MKQSNNNIIIIFSHERNDRPSWLNLNLADQVETVLTHWVETDLIEGWAPAIGAYTHKNEQKVTEASFVVELNFAREAEALERLKRLAFGDFDQESILVLDPVRNASLLYADGYSQTLGTFHAVEGEPENYTELNGVKYSA